MTYHVLNGDALFNTFIETKLDGEIIVDRECLIEGDLQSDTLSEFWLTRANYLSLAYNETEAKYFDGVASEFEKLLEVRGDAEVNLWFGYDLFCQANLWFLLSILNNSRAFRKIFIVYPSFLCEDERWNDFGSATKDDLIYAYANKIELSKEDISLGEELWKAYKNNNLDKLKELSHLYTRSFPYLKEVVQAHIDRFAKAGEKNRPEKVVEDIIKNVSSEFSIVFREFYRREGVYGFGDSQVKKIYGKVNEKL
jgi:hypothetical protein